MRFDPIRAGPYHCDMFDLLITNGTVVDGTGADRRIADIAITDGRIVAIGTDLGEAHEIIDAQGLLVTPGFVDVHSHYDGQATWDELLEPSSLHGVTTLVMGNCGVGFAPVGASLAARPVPTPFVQPAFVDPMLLGAPIPVPPGAVPLPVPAGAVPLPIAVAPTVAAPVPLRTYEGGGQTTARRVACFSHDERHVVGADGPRGAERREEQQVLDRRDARDERAEEGCDQVDLGHLLGDGGLQHKPGARRQSAQQAVHGEGEG